MGSWESRRWELGARKWDCLEIGVLVGAVGGSGRMYDAVCQLRTGRDGRFWPKKGVFHPRLSSDLASWADDGVENGRGGVDLCLRVNG